MSTTDLIALFTLAFTILGSGWAILAWALDKYASVKKQVAAQEQSSTDAAIKSLAALVEKLATRVEQWEKLHTDQVRASTQQIHQFELSLKGYSHELEMLNKTTSDQFRHWAGQVDKIWTTMVTEIRPDVFRVSGKPTKKG